MNEPKPGFLVCGISVRTNNTTELSAEGRIAKLWDKFVKDNVLAQIPNKKTEDVYAVYTNYRSDYHGDYEVIIGSHVAIPTNEGDFRTVAVKPGMYAHFKSENGPLPEVIVNLWQKVWKMTDKELGGHRAYSTDYEVYSKASITEPQNCIVDLYIGI